MKTTLSGLLKFFLIIIPWLLVGCGSTSKVFTDYDKSANLDQYQTFGWLTQTEIEERNNPLYYNELNDKRIKFAVGEQMESRNYRFSENPELLIHYHIIINDRTMLRTDPYGYYGPYWMTTEVTMYEYREGTLIVDFMDAATNSLVWRGWVTNFLKNSDPQKMEKSMNDAVNMIFSKYTYRAGNKEESIDLHN